MNCPPSDWLWKQCKKHEDEAPNSDELQLPMKSGNNGQHSEYKIDDLFDDQLEIVTVVMDKIIEWATCENIASFIPLRLTINGPGGTGKTIVINTLVTLIRKMFNNNDVIKVCAPTGTAAFNAGGETVHHLMENKAGVYNYDPFSMPQTKKEKLTAKLKSLVCLIIDERSLLDSTITGVTEQMLSETIHNGSLDNYDWGHLPVLILVGDDYQLPSITKGAFDSFDQTTGSKVTIQGAQLLRGAADTVMSLTVSKRIKKKQTMDKEIIGKTRTAEPLTDEEANKLLNLHLTNIHAKHGQKVIDDIKRKSIYLFYRNNKRIMKNLEVLVEKTGPYNPVATCKTKSNGLYDGKAIKKHFRSSELPSTALLALETRVALSNRNFCPQWGLHNGAVGTVKEIVFQHGKNPNNGDLPEYTVVDFPLYQGPTWDNDNPTHVPIPTTMYRCDKGCCTRTFVPLELAYARTIHKFQGLTAGPVDKGRIPNIYECIICDPDEKKYEGSSLGLLYTALSRATTLGDEHGLGSAIYFIGSDFKAEQITRLTKKKNSDECFVQAQKRQKWVDYITNQEQKTKHRIKPILNRATQILQMTSDLTADPECAFDYDFLYTRKQEYIKAFAV